MERPVFLQIQHIRLPITAISSIFHRVSGLFLVLLLPGLLFVLNKSLASPAEFQQISAVLTGFVGKFFTWAFLTAFGYHCIAGIRHLLMDVGIGETLCGGRLGAKLVIAIGVLMAVIWGVWLW